jgi:two-component system phosphate regulon sensor histidine kinase PhoR
MRLKKLVWHIFPANLLITAGSLLALLWYGSSALDAFYNSWLASDLEDRAYFIEEQVVSLIRQDKQEKLKTLCRRIGRKTSTRITVIQPSGKVIADSDENPEIMGDHSDRPEIISAFSGKTGTELRFSATLGVKMLYVAIPLADESPEEHNKSVNVLRMAMPTSAIDQALQSLRMKIALSGFVVVLLAMLAAILVSRRISRPLELMTEGAKQFARENFTTSLAISSNCSLEVGTLATAMNSMAQKLQERFSTIVQQRNELQTILASMVDAVLVIDNNKQIKTINTAASHLFDVSAEKATNKSTQEILRNINIERLVNLTLAGKRVVTEEVIINKNGEKLFLQYSGVQLYDDSDHSFGAVMTFHDVTHIRRLENIRQEFVANVSHELMTPLTSIKGYTETILDGTQNDKEQTEKFLQIILRQSDRLQAIVSDLLNLSKIEQEIENAEILPVPTNLKGVLDQAIQVCSHKAVEKGLTIELDCPAELVAPLDAQLMEQAVVNLLVNAIKYSDPVKRIEIKAGLQTVANGEEKAVITVRDYGIGIGREHLPRLFERFYRSDKDRSRKLGGTGLGLAIVKHIVQAHNGHVNVASEIGQGSTFTIILPTKQLY